MIETRDMILEIRDMTQEIQDMIPESPKFPKMWTGTMYIFILFSVFVNKVLYHFIFYALISI